MEVGGRHALDGRQKNIFAAMVKDTISRIES
jgi:hypothetical protein